MIDDKVSVLILTSVIPSHPNIDIFAETLESLRWHFPDANVTILADGLREEQKDAIERYALYVGALEGLCSYPESGVTMVAFEEHRHQIGMLRHVMPEIQTPYIFFCEHDTPMVKRPIDWDAIHMELHAGTVDFVRFLPEPQIHPEHEMLMGQTIETSRLRLRETIQFSARPHIATKNFYERLLARFSPEANCFVEDGAHSICQSEPWSEWKMVIYLGGPNETDAKFSYHLDGRAQSRKWDELQVF